MTEEDLESESEEDLSESELLRTGKKFSATAKIALALGSTSSAADVDNDESPRQAKKDKIQSKEKEEEEDKILDSVQQEFDTSQFSTKVSSSGN